MRSRESTQYTLVADPYGYEVKPQATDYYENSYGSTCDGVIQIVDEADGEIDNEIDFSRVNMGTIITPSGAAAALVEPILSDSSNEGKRAKIRRTDRKPELPRNNNETEEMSENASSYEIVNPFQANNDRPIDSDYHFLMSIYPYMRELNSSQKLRFQMKIQKLIYKELYGGDGTCNGETD